MKRSGSSLFFAVIWLALITFLLCTNGSKLPKIGWQDKIMLDKWVHIFLFTILVLLWCRSFSHKIDQKKKFLLIVYISIAYGIIMEVIQGLYIPYRSFEIPDIIADGVGSFLGYIISLKRFIKK